MKNIKISAIASAIFLPTLVQAQATSPMEVSATVVPGCFIEANNINFGTLSMPLNTQTATSELSIKCSKNTNVTLSIPIEGLELNYKVFGGSENDIYYLEYINSYISKGYQGGSMNEYKLLKGNTNLAPVYCHANGYLDAHQVTKDFGITSCYINENGESVPIGWNNPSKTGKSVINSGGYLSLRGFQSNEMIKYTMIKPDTNNETWMSSNKYSLLTNGDIQKINMTAKISNTDNPTYRMTPDIYQDTLTVILTY